MAIGTGLRQIRAFHSANHPSISAGIDNKEVA